MAVNDAYSIMRDLFLFGVTAAAATILVSAEKATQQNRASPIRIGTATSGDAELSLRRRLQEGTTLDAMETVCTVSENNIPTRTGHARREVRLNNLWHRATYIVVRHDRSGEGTSGCDGEIYILVQRRSKLKDYCPGKLDPAPGGVVGFGEEYNDNARRELEEEMGINVTDPTSPHKMRKLFTFPYEDDRVRCWGELYEAVYTGSLDELRIQEEEVDEVLRMSLADLKKLAVDRPDELTPDGLHALKLYLQHRHDRSLRRRLLPGYSSGNLEAYTLRPKPRAIFFDCDDCLYFDDWNIANLLTSKIDQWCVERAGLPKGEAYKLYKKHGTALRGLLAEGHMEHCEKAIDDFLEEVHDLPIHSLLDRDEDLREMLCRMDPSVPKYVFTASVRHHAERCLRALGIHDMFDDIIDVRSCRLVTKHSTEAFEEAMRIAGVDDPESCVFLDDSLKNINAARNIGWRSVLVGRTGRDCGKRISSEHAEHEIDSIHEFPSVFPELFDH